MLTTWMLWAHLLATVVLIGYYAVLALILLPVLQAIAGNAPTTEDSPGPDLQLLASVERVAMPLILGALVIFLATGVSLLTSDQRYTGAGSIKDAWATLLLIKHVVIVGMLVLGSTLDGLIVRAARVPGAGIGARITWLTRGMAAIGALVLLLTAAAQGA